MHLLISSIKHIYRKIIHNKLFSVINILCLSIGLSSSFLMFEFVNHESSYDQYNKKINRIYRINTNFPKFGLTNITTPFLLKNEVKRDIPETETAARTYRLHVKILSDYNENLTAEAYCADQEIFSILTFKFIYGNSSAFLNNSNNILISEGFSKKYFGRSESIGKILQIYTRGEKYSLKIAGVYKNIPETSTFQTDIILPIHIAEKDINKRYMTRYKFATENWRPTVVQTYILLRNNRYKPEVQKKLKMYEEHTKSSYNPHIYLLQNYGDIYFGSNDMNGNWLPSGDKQMISILLSVSILLLIISCVNFILLSLAISYKYSKAYSIRKILGAAPFILIAQPVLESFMLAILSLPVSLLIILYSFHEISNLLNITIKPGYIFNFQSLLLFLLLILVVSVLTGLIYYSFQNKRYSLLDADHLGVTRKIKNRYVFVLLQTIIFCGMIFCSIVMYRQLALLKNSDLGFDPNNILVIKMDNSNVIKKYNSFKNELIKLPEVINVTASMEFPSQVSAILGKLPKSNNPSEYVTVNSIDVDYDFVKTLKMKLIEGREFSKEFPVDSINSVILNNKAVQMLELGKNRNLSTRLKVIGVLKDFNFLSLRHNIEPLMIRISNSSNLDEIEIRVRKSQIETAINKIKKAWDKNFSNVPFEYSFLTDNINAMYKNESRFLTLISIFTFLIIIVTCLGLYGLNLFIIGQREKEIAIRKVLGSSIFNINLLITKEFILITLAASVISLPVVSYFIDGWLNNFAYKVSIGISTVLLSVLTGMVLTLIPIAFETWKAGISNPVKYLHRN
ncbi:MAG: ABC transporter permease [Ignavibacteriaceae bacterium]